jgi:restriction system protein
VVKYLRHQGFTEIKITKNTNDFGFDIVATKSNRRYAIQVQRRLNKIAQSAVHHTIADKSPNLRSVATASKRN